jgi:hypothetical protein
VSTPGPKRLGILYGGSLPEHRVIADERYQPWLAKTIYLPDLSPEALTDLDGLIVPEGSNHRALQRAADTVQGFLARGGTVIAFGEQQVPLLPNVTWEYRPTNFWWWLDPNASSGLVLSKPEHSLFEYLTLEDCTWHQHGVFYPDKGTETMISLEDGGAIMYLDRVSTGGTLLMTTLDPTYHYGSYFMPATERFLDGFLPWVRAKLLKG